MEGAQERLVDFSMEKQNCVPQAYERCFPLVGEPVEPKMRQNNEEMIEIKNFHAPRPPSQIVLQITSQPFYYGTNGLAVLFLVGLCTFLLIWNTFFML